MIAQSPLHRSGRAALLHPGPAWDDNAEAHERAGRGTAPFPRRVLPRMRGVSDRAGPCCVSRWQRARCGLAPLLTASAPRSDHPVGAAVVFRGEYPACRFPCQPLASLLADADAWLGVSVGRKPFPV